MKKRMTVVIASLLASGAASAGMGDDPLLSMVRIDQFESRQTDGDDPWVWNVQGWVGYDLNKVWFKTEGERVGGETEEAEVQLLYGRAVAPFWDLQAGWRRDLRPEPSRDWLVLGIQGLAPYWFEVDAAVFLGKDGRTAARLDAEYEILFTQRLVLTPEVELNFYGKDDPAAGIGSGLSKMDLGLRLRYEIRREFAPYVGVNWTRTFGTTADLVRASGGESTDVQWVVGLRAWF